MIAIPAIDIRDGACVQLVGGSYADERVRIADPIAVARRFSDAGFKSLHVVDLDAATEGGSNAALVDELLASRTAEVQVGGGVAPRASSSGLARSRSPTGSTGSRTVGRARSSRRSMSATASPPPTGGRSRAGPMCATSFAGSTRCRSPPCS
jgi:phosphoribosylformimino-5-aminoimidazole carboxamide ribotide isomerase